MPNHPPGPPPPPPPNDPSAFSSESRAATLYGASSTCWILAVTAVTLRFLARRYKGQKLWLDDWFILAAVFPATINTLALIVGTRNGMGHHYMWLLKQDPSLDFLGLIYRTSLPGFAAELTFALTIALVKFSLLSFIWRIFEAARKLRIPIIIVACINGAWLVARMVGTLLSCVPLRSRWDKKVPGTCQVDTKNFVIGTSVVHLLLDVVIILLPIREIMGLKMSLRKKILLCGVFTVGGFVTAIAIYGVVAGLNLPPGNPDFTWMFAPMALWANVEQLLAVIVACMPSLHPFIRHFSFTYIFSSFTSKKSTSSSSKFGKISDPSSTATGTTAVMSDRDLEKSHTTTCQTFEMTTMDRTQPDPNEVDEMDPNGNRHSVIAELGRHHYQNSPHSRYDSETTIEAGTFSERHGSQVSLVSNRLPNERQPTTIPSSGLPPNPQSAKGDTQTVIIEHKSSERSRKTKSIVVKKEVRVSSFSLGSNPSSPTAATL